LEKKKISIIKEVKVITGLSLIKAKEVVDSIPQIIKNNVPRKVAEEIKKRLQSLGADVELK
jgi:large subunit ribosomal protein L7/L12